MSEVVSLHGSLPQGHVNPLVIETLEAVLEKARRGEVTAIAVATVEANDSLGRIWNFPDNKHWAVLASIDLMQAAFLKCMVEGSHNA